MHAVREHKGEARTLCTGTNPHPPVMRWNALSQTLYTRTPTIVCIPSAMWPHDISIHSLLRFLPGMAAFSLYMHTGHHVVFSDRFRPTYFSIDQMMEYLWRVQAIDHWIVASGSRMVRILNLGVLACALLSLSMPSPATAMPSPSPIKSPTSPSPKSPSPGSPSPIVYPPSPYPGVPPSKCYKGVTACRPSGFTLSAAPCMYAQDHGLALSFVILHPC
jgi:hypothetical protein